MIIPVTFVFLYLRLAQTNAQVLFEGDSCTLSDETPGICRLIFDCKPVYDQVVSGDLPDTVCGYRSADPIVCCPKESRPTIVTTTSPTSNSRDRLLVGDGRGAIARAKCKYYSQFVYTLKYSVFGAPIKWSQCVVTSQKLITGGKKAERMEFPHSVVFGYNDDDGKVKWFCGGTLISENYVLTAAHCFFSTDSVDGAFARLGDLSLVDSVPDGATPVTMRIADTIAHPQYRPPEEYYDIALVRLERSVVFNGWIRPACLHTSPTTGTSKAIVTGWGRVEWIDEDGSSDLLKVTLSLLDSATCHERWTTTGQVESKLPRGIDGKSMICASDPGKDACQGDSGGPMVVFSQPEYECMYDVVGVTSLGKDCGKNFPGVYGRVYNYVPWIESIVWPRG